VLFDGALHLDNLIITQLASKARITKCLNSFNLDNNKNFVPPLKKGNNGAHKENKKNSLKCEQTVNGPGKNGYVYIMTTGSYNKDANCTFSAFLLNGMTLFLERIVQVNIK